MLHHLGVRRRAATLALAGALGAGALALGGASAAASATANRIANCNTSSTRPATVIVTCGDAGILLTDLRWSSFGGRTAMATGTLKVDECQPDCVAGKVASYPVKVTAKDAKACPGGVHDYLDLALVFTDDRMQPKKGPDHYPLVCPPA